MSEDSKASAAQIPVLTDVVADRPGVEEPAEPDDNAALIAELQTALAARAFALAEETLRAAFAEMEATLFEQITGKLRRELPELIDNVLREHLETREDDS